MIDYDVECGCHGAYTAFDCRYLDVVAERDALADKLEAAEQMIAELLSALGGAEGHSGLTEEETRTEMAKLMGLNAVAVGAPESDAGLCFCGDPNCVWEPDAE